LRYLNVSRTLLQRIPAGLCALRELRIMGCTALADDWRPDCSAAHVLTLDAGGSNLTRLPDGLVALTKLTCKDSLALQ
jgi:hypothetical protein